MMDDVAWGHLLAGWQSETIEIDNIWQTARPLQPYNWANNETATQTNKHFKMKASCRCQGASCRGTNHPWQFGLSAAKKFTCTDGAHFSNSSIQLDKVESGTMMR